jgi:hypothetical protein
MQVMVESKIIIDKMDKIIIIIKNLIKDKFTGKIEINFNQGGITGLFKVERKKLT